MNLLKSFLAEMRAALTRKKQAEAEFSSHFTPRVRDMFVFAEAEATRLKHNFIGTEHVLLGLLKLGCGVGVNVLRRQGVDLEKVRASVEEHVRPGPDVTILKPIPFTPRVKAVLVTAHEEARMLNHPWVGTEHVLLGLLSEKNGVAARVLEGFGITVSQIRQEIRTELDPNVDEGSERSQD